MAEGSAKAPRGIRTICVPVCEDEYQQIVGEPQQFRQLLDQRHREMPELFPPNFHQGYRMKDQSVSRKLGLTMRRIQLRDGTAYTIHPSFVMPFLTARTKDVEAALFLRKFSVPFWALARVFGRDHDYWFRLEAGLGRQSIVGTTLRKAAVPQDLLADEHHQTRDGKKNYIATTVAGGCCLGAELAETAQTDELKAAYSVFRDEARDVNPDYVPRTVNTDGWRSTQTAWKWLFPAIVVLQCFLHAWLKIRDRAKHLKGTYGEIRQKVWEAYHAPDRRTFSQHLRRLSEWAQTTLTGIVLEKVLDLYEKRDLWEIAFDYPEGHRTSNMLERIMRSMNRYFFDGQHLHGSLRTTRRHCRAWALLYNFTPWHPATTRANNGWRSPAERLNQHRYHDSWLQNLLISSSLAGFRKPPQNP